MIGLLLRSQLELDEMVHHPLFAIIFQLDYVVNIPCAQEELTESKRNRTKVNRYAHCLIFIFNIFLQLLCQMYQEKNI